MTHKLKIYLSYVSIFFIPIVLFYIINHVFLTSTIETYTKKHNNDIKTSIENIKESSQKISTVIYKNIFENPIFVDLYKRINNDEKNNAEIRQELYNFLYPKYKVLKLVDIQQLHFHLPDNKSFLRMHKPDKFGDDLTYVRRSVAYVNRYKKYIRTFEEGRVYSGFRYVFPLFDEKDYHLGSVEISTSVLSLIKSIEKNKSISMNIVMKKHVSQRKLFKTQQNNYTDFSLDENYYIQNEALEYEKSNINYDTKQVLIKKLSKDPSVHKMMEENKEFSKIEKLSDYYIINFIPLNNKITNETVGYIISFTQSKYLNTIFQTKRILFFITLVFSLLLVVFFYKLNRSKEKMQKFSQRNRTIIDSSTNMIIVFSGNTIVDANDMFYKFFGISSLDEFSYLDSFDTLFRDNYGAYTNHSNTHWIKDLLQLKALKNTLCIHNQFDQEYIFEPLITKLYDNEFEWVVVLNNITKMKHQNLTLQNEMDYDKLLGIYNRSYFENYIEQIFKEKTNHTESISMVMFDIDFFKVVNDTYGHDVGDQALHELVNITKHAIRATDIFARWGGEEFIIILEADLNKSFEIIEHLRQKIEQTTKQNKRIPEFTCSFSIIDLTKHSNKEESFKELDKKLYQAKHSGRNTVVI